MIRPEEEEEKEADDCVPDLGGQSSLQRVAAVAEVLSLLAGGKKQNCPTVATQEKMTKRRSVRDCVGERGALNGLGGCGGGGTASFLFTKSACCEPSSFGKIW